MKNLQQLQAEIGKWAQEQFQDNLSKDLTAKHYNECLDEIPSFMGMVGELGELSQLDLRAIQGRSKLPNYGAIQEAREDALADLLVFMCDYAYRREIDLNIALDKAWQKVSQRRQKTWEQDKAKEATANFGAGCGEGHHEWDRTSVCGHEFSRCKVCGLQQVD